MTTWSDDNYPATPMLQNRDDLTWDDVIYQGSRLGSLEPGEEPWGGRLEEPEPFECHTVTGRAGAYGGRGGRYTDLVQCWCGARHVKHTGPGVATCRSGCLEYKPLERDALVDRGGPK